MPRHVAERRHHVRRVSPEGLTADGREKPRAEASGVIPSGFTLHSSPSKPQQPSISLLLAFVPTGRQLATDDDSAGDDAGRCRRRRRWRWRWRLGRCQQQPAERWRRRRRRLGWSQPKPATGDSGGGGDGAERSRPLFDGSGGSPRRSRRLLVRTHQPLPANRRRWRTLSVSARPG
jgi:hypothetical protein